MKTSFYLLLRFILFRRVNCHVFLPLHWLIEFYIIQAAAPSEQGDGWHWIGFSSLIIKSSLHLEFSSLIIKHYKGVAWRAPRPGELPQQVEEAKWCDSVCDEDYLGRNHWGLEGNFSSPLTTFDIVCFACCWIYIVNPTDKCKLYNDQGSQIKISGFPRDKEGMQSAMIILLRIIFNWVARVYSSLSTSQWLVSQLKM